MTSPSPSAVREIDDEYRAIESTLLESGRGRWFLAEHGRRARRLDSALLEDAIGRLQGSLREPPALLDQLECELKELKTFIQSVHQQLMARPSATATVTGKADEGTAPQSILKTVEDVHEIAWSLQANPFDPKGCKEIARSAARLYTLSQDQAAYAVRTLAIADALEGATAKVDALLETVLHERSLESTMPPAA